MTMTEANTDSIGGNAAMNILGPRTYLNVMVKL